MLGTIDQHLGFKGPAETFYCTNTIFFFIVGLFPKILSQNNSFMIGENSTIESYV